jgi:hypothetical protein
MRRTYVELIAAALDTFPNQQASESKLKQKLGWDDTKFSNALKRALAEPSKRIATGPGGVIKHRGSERYSSSGVGIYTDVSRVISDYWAPRVLKARRIDMRITARGGRRGAGEWTHPDIVMAAFPGRRANPTDPKFLHAIEVETHDGFDIRSIYQAHAQAQGADFAWVFTFGNAIDEGDRYDRIHWAAEEIGVGLVEFERPGASTTYKTIIKARRLNPDPIRRSAFVNRVLGEPDDSPLLMG